MLGLRYSIWMGMRASQKPKAFDRRMDENCQTSAPAKSESRHQR